MIPNYEYITKHFNASTEHEMSFTYDEELQEITNRMVNDPRLPKPIRDMVPTYKYFHRDFMRRAIRSYAYALRYPNQVEEPILVLKSSIYKAIRTLIHSMPYQTYRETAKWRNTWAKILVEELYDQAKYMEKFSKKGNIQPLNYWGNGQAKNRYLPSKEPV